MSPEQVRENRATIVRTFLFRRIALRVLSGTRAFRGESAAETMAAIAQKDPPELTGIDASLARA